MTCSSVSISPSSSRVLRSSLYFLIIFNLSLFLGISFFCLFLFRLLYKEKIMTKNGEDAEYSPVGKKATVVETVSSVGGKVRLDDVYWKAVCEEETEISVDNIVVVVASEGTTLKVKLKLKKHLLHLSMHFV